MGRRKGNRHMSAKRKPNRSEQRRARALAEKQGITYLQSLEQLRKFDNPDQDGTYPNRALALIGGGPPPQYPSEYPNRALALLELSPEMKPSSEAVVREVEINSWRS